MDILEQVTYEVQAATEQWTDERMKEGQDLDDLLIFWVYLPNVLSQLGFRYKGYQLRQTRDSWLLVVKVTDGTVPLVVFETAGTPMGCIRMFVRQLNDDRITWNKDKYPWN